MSSKKKDVVGKMCCGHCSGTVDLKACKGCRRVHYCSTACQTEHWRNGGHKARCAELAARTPTAAAAAAVREPWATRTKIAHVDKRVFDGPPNMWNIRPEVRRQFFTKLGVFVPYRSGRDPDDVPICPICRDIIPLCTNERRCVLCDVRLCGECAEQPTNNKCVHCRATKPTTTESIAILKRRIGTSTERPDDKMVLAYLSSDADTLHMLAVRDERVAAYLLEHLNDTDHKDRIALLVQAHPTSELVVYLAERKGRDNQQFRISDRPFFLYNTMGAGCGFVTACYHLGIQLVSGVHVSCDSRMLPPGSSDESSMVYFFLTAEESFAIGGQYIQYAAEHGHAEAQERWKIMGPAFATIAME